MVAQASTSAVRTSFSVQTENGLHRETIAGACSVWLFRPHYHLGDEMVRILGGRARLRIGPENRIVTAGERVVIPARTVHRFEPIDAEGWAFSSAFLSSFPDGTDASQPGTQERGLAARAKVLLRQRGSLHTDVSRIAATCAVSEQYLARRFRLETGTSLHSFHVLMTLLEAKALLKRGASIVQAALGTGFYDQAHLTREFVSTYGLTPGTFRRAWLAAPKTAIVE